MTSSQEHEQDIARLFRQRGLDAKVQPGSGNRDYNPNDVRSNDADLMIECKVTEKRSMTFQLSWIERVKDKSMTFFKRGVVAMRFKLPWPAKPKDYIIIDFNFFMHLLECERQVGKCVCQ
jgi:Holliday junction resolvase